MWKKKYEAGQDVVPEQEIIDKICAFFGCSESWLRGIEKAPTLEDERRFDDDDLKFALWGNASDIDDEDLEDVRRYAAFVAERKKKKQ